MTAKEDYAKFYDLDSSEEDDEKEKLKAKPSKKKEVAKKNRDNTSEEDSDTEDERVPEGSEESEDDDTREGKAAELEPEIVAKLRDENVDYARGEKCNDNSALSYHHPHCSGHVKSSAQK